MPQTYAHMRHRPPFPRTALTLSVAEGCSTLIAGPSGMLYTGATSSLPPLSPPHTRHMLPQGAANRRCCVSLAACGCLCKVCAMGGLPYFNAEHPIRPHLSPGHTQLVCMRIAGKVEVRDGPWPYIIPQRAYVLACGTLTEQVAYPDTGEKGKEPVCWSRREVVKGVGGVVLYVLYPLHVSPTPLAMPLLSVDIRGQHP